MGDRNERRNDGKPAAVDPVSVIFADPIDEQGRSVRMRAAYVALGMGLLGIASVIPLLGKVSLSSYSHWMRGVVLAIVALYMGYEVWRICNRSIGAWRARYMRESIETRLRSRRDDPELDQAYREAWKRHHASLRSVREAEIGVEVQRLKTRLDRIDAELAREGQSELQREALKNEKRMLEADLNSWETKSTADSLLAYADRQIDLDTEEDSVFEAALHELNARASATEALLRHDEPEEESPSSTDSRSGAGRTHHKRLRRERLRKEHRRLLEDHKRFQKKRKRYAETSRPYWPVFFTWFLLFLGAIVATFIDSPAEGTTDESGKVVEIIHEGTPSTLPATPPRPWLGTLHQPLSDSILTLSFPIFESGEHESDEATTAWVENLMDDLVRSLAACDRRVRKPLIHLVGFADSTCFGNASPGPDSLCQEPDSDLQNSKLANLRAATVREMMDSELLSQVDVSVRNWHEKELRVMHHASGLLDVVPDERLTPARFKRRVELQLLDAGGCASREVAGDLVASLGDGQGPLVTASVDLSR